MLNVYRAARKTFEAQSKGYVRREAAERKVKELLEANSEYADVGLVVYDEDQKRYCPVFVIDKMQGGYVMRYSSLGFLSM